MKFVKSLLGVLPPIVLYVIQFMIMIPATMLAAGIALAQGVDTSNAEVLTAKIMDVYNSMMGPMLLLVELISIVVFGLWYYFMFVRKTKQFSPMRCISGYSIPALLLAVVGLFFISNGILTLVYYACPAWYESYSARMESSGITSGLGLVAAIALAPIAEDLALRGISYRTFKWAGWSTLVAVILQGVLFGLMHIYPLQVCYTVLVGLVLGYLVAKYDCVWIGIAGHVLYNFSGTIISEWMSKLPLPDWSMIPAGVFGIFLVAAAIILVVVDPKAQVKLLPKKGAPASVAEE